MLTIARQSYRKRSCTSGLAWYAICGGNTSGTPPTSVVTTKSPQQAASRIAIQNDSVSEVLRKIWPRHSTSLTWLWLSAPRSSILECKLYFSTSAFIYTILSPSPPIIKFTCGKRDIIFGINPINRSTPLRYCNRDIKTILIYPFGSLPRIMLSG